MMSKLFVFFCGVILSVSSPFFSTKVLSQDEYNLVSPVMFDRVISDKEFTRHVVGYLNKTLQIDKDYKGINPNGDYSKNEKLQKKLNKLDQRVNREGGPTKYDGLYFDVFRKRLLKKLEKGETVGDLITKGEVFYKLRVESDVHKQIDELKSITTVKEAETYFKKDYEIKLAVNSDMVSRYCLSREKNSLFMLIAKNAYLLKCAKEEKCPAELADERRIKFNKFKELVSSDNKNNSKEIEIKTLLFDDVFKDLDDQGIQEQMKGMITEFATARKFNPDVIRLKDIVLRAKPPLKKRLAHKIGNAVNSLTRRLRTVPVNSVPNEAIELTRGENEDSV